MKHSTTEFIPTLESVIDLTLQIFLHKSWSGSNQQNMTDVVTFSCKDKFKFLLVSELAEEVIPGLACLYMLCQTVAIHTMVPFSVVVRSKGYGNKSQNAVFYLNRLNLSILLYSTPSFCSLLARGTSC